MEISRAALMSNLSALRAVSGGDTEVLAVIKADGYGHHAETVAPLLAEAGVRWLGVTDAEEGARVRAVVGPEVRLLVMVAPEESDAEAIVEFGLTPCIWTAEHVRFLAAAAEKSGRPLAVHLEVDTGMSRQGAAVGAELEDVLGVLAGSRWVRTEGVMTHLAESEVAESAVTAVQRERFAAALEQVRAAGLRPELVHMGNTSAVDEGATLGWLRERAAAMGARMMVRPGYAIYGHCLPVEGGSGRLVSQLTPALQWKTRVIGLRTVEPGATVGYGATFVAERTMRLALLPVGYADGFRRAASSGIGDGWVRIAGERCAVVGRVSMNLTVVDVSALAEVAVGDEVTLLGEGVSAEDHARWTGTIGYDILCGLRAHAVIV